MSTYQQGWVREVPRAGWTAYKVCWRERLTDGTWGERTRTLPQFRQDGKPTLRKDADKELTKILQTVNANNGVTSQPLAVRQVTFNDLLEKHWDDYVDRQKLRASTLDGYRAILKNWIIPFFGEMQLSKITKETVSDFFKKMRTEGCADQYQKNAYHLVNKIFELATTFDLIPSTPVKPLLHRPRVERGEKAVLPLDKIRTFFEVLDDFWRRVFLVLILSGMRQGELLGLRWMDIDFERRLIRKSFVVYRGKLTEGIKQTRRTGRARSHVIGMPNLVVQVLGQHRAATTFNKPEDFVFCREDGRPLDPDHIRRYVLYPAFEKCGIPVADRETGLHAFRHTVASILNKKVRDLKMVQDQLGHSDINTTANVYTHVDEEQKLLAADHLQEAFAAQLLPNFAN